MDAYFQKRFRKDCSGSKTPSNQQKPTSNPNQANKMPPNSNMKPNSNLPIKMTPNPPSTTRQTTNTRRTPTTTPRPIDIATSPRQVQTNNGFNCTDSLTVKNGRMEKMKRDFDYFALSMNWPETSCRFLMTKGKTCSIPGQVLISRNQNSTELKSKHYKAKVDQWIIHGLWPNYEEKQHSREKFPEYCSGRDHSFNTPLGQLKARAILYITYNMSHVYKL